MSTLDPLIEGYLSYLTEVGRKAPRTVIDVRCTLKRIAQTFEERRPGMPLWKVSFEDYLGWIESEREAGSSIACIAKYLSHLRGLIEYAWRSGRTERNVLDGFQLQDAPSRHMPNFLTLDEAEKLVRSCPRVNATERRDRLMILLLYGCGLRTMELCGLDVADISRERQELTIRHGKGDRPRVIPIPEGLYTELLAHLLEHGRRGALFRTVQRVRRISEKDVCAVVSATAARAGLPPSVTARTLRHSFATHLMDRGVDLAVIASLMGHRSPQETGVYARTAAAARGGGAPAEDRCARCQAMRWAYWMQLYLRTHCVARGLSPLSIAAYEATLAQFRAWIEGRTAGTSPDRVTARDVLEYLEYLRGERDNGAAAVNRTVTILRSFYRAIVAMGHLEPANNPLAGFPSIKGAPRKLPVVLDGEEVGRLLATPEATTVLGVRDRALLALLYGTGIRASECAGLREGQVNLRALTVTVRGKGGHERTVPYNEEVATRLREYVQVRGSALPSAPFFRSRFRKAISRGTVYERVRTLARRARLAKPMSPHRLRHTFASHLVREGVGLVTIRDLLGHRLITSTQIYLHVTAQDLRAAADRHPISRLLSTIEHLLPHVRLPFQRPGARCATA